MAATKLAFLTQPLSTTSGYTIQAGQQDSVNLRENHGLRVAVQDATGAIVTTDTSTVTIVISSGTGTLRGTTTAAAVNGIATFSDLSITPVGTGAFTLSATDGGLTPATSNPFTITAINRINPAVLVGTVSATGLANAFGPYRYRAGSNLKGLTFVGTGNDADVLTISTVPPGGTLNAANNSIAGILNIAKTLFLELGGDVDVYLVGTTISGTDTIYIYPAQSSARA